MHVIFKMAMRLKIIILQIWSPGDMARRDDAAIGERRPNWEKMLAFKEGCEEGYILKVLGIQEKICFLTIHCNPSLAYIAVRDLQSSQRNTSVQSLRLAGNLLYNQ